jgi:hypothetical protein
MLTDEQIHEIALAHVRHSGDDLILSRPVKLSDPDGAFYKVTRPLGKGSTNLVNPFLVRRDNGRVIPISPGDVMPGIITKLYGWAAMRADPELQRAVIDPDFNVPRHVDVWSAIIRECVASKGGP